MGAVMRALGGVPIDRSARHGVVEQAVERFATSERLVLAVPPEGTRGRAPHWKTGFYHIARGAGVPIVLGYIDYGRKVAGLGPAFMPTGDLDADFEVFRDFYSKVTAKHPAMVGPVAPAKTHSAPHLCPDEQRPVVGIELDERQRHVSDRRFPPVERTHRWP